MALLLLLGLCGALPGAAPASTNDDARLALHLRPVQPGNACGASAAQVTCDGVITSGGLEPTAYFAYLVVLRGDPVAGLAGLQFGITYDNAEGRGVDIYYWHHCATLEFPSGNWPQAGSGNLVTWDSALRCQRAEPGGAGTGVVAVAGYFYLGAYSTDRLRLTPRPVDGLAKVASCGPPPVESVVEGGAVHHDPSHLGELGFSADGSLPGFNPCSAPGLPACDIGGPDILVRGTGGNVYTAVSPPGGATLHWSVSGSGTLAGPVDGPTVQVLAGGGGSLTVALDVTEGGGTSTCQRLVPLIDPAGAISGPDSLDAGDIQSFLATTNLPHPQYAWSVTGAATATGGLNGNTVTVQAGETGSATLAVTISGGGVSIGVTRVVGVRPARCAITGPTAVVAGSSGNTYAAGHSGGAGLSVVGWHWSVAGDGSLTSPPNQATALVTAGSAGGYSVAVDMTLSDGVVLHCTLDAAIHPATCVISGPTSVSAGSTDVTYDSGPLLAGATYAWSVGGNASIASAANGRTVRVNVGAPGSFTLLLSITGSGAPLTCGTIVTVTPAGGCTPGRQGNAKLLLHVRGRTVKNPCSLSTLTCGNVVTRARLYPELYFVYLMVTDGAAEPGIGGLECGIQYNGTAHQGVDVFSWSLCASLETATAGWPQAGGGNRILWDSATRCQRAEPGGAGNGVVATAGYFYAGAYTADEMRVEVHPTGGAARVLDCESCESIVAPAAGFSPLGRVRFTAAGDVDGYNPCLDLRVPVVPTTWSAIKAIYGPR